MADFLSVYCMIGNIDLSIISTASLGKSNYPCHHFHHGEQRFMSKSQAGMTFHGYAFYCFSVTPFSSVSLSNYSYSVSFLFLLSYSFLLLFLVFVFFFSTWTCNCCKTYIFLTVGFYIIIPNINPDY